MKDRARNSIIEGTVYGVLSAATAFLVVRVMGYNPESLAVLLYLYVVSGVLLTARSKIAAPFIPLLKRVVIVAEGEEMKLKRILTGEEYRVRDVEKL